MAEPPARRVLAPAWRCVPLTEKLPLARRTEQVLDQRQSVAAALLLLDHSWRLLLRHLLRCLRACIHMRCRHRSQEQDVGCLCICA